MVNEEHYACLNKDVKAWNKWRYNNLNIIPDLMGAKLSDADLSEANLNGANLNEADLMGAKLSDADLSMANVSGANLIWVNLSDANLSDANLSDANLNDANLRFADFSGANLSNTDLNRANLSGANLSEVDLNEANLSGANLSNTDLNRANLSGANLSGANLSFTQALGTDFTGAKFTGACLEDWHINSATKLNNIDCQYVYLKSDKQERRPSSGEFAAGEFTKLFQKALETVDLIFRDGIDWQAFLTSFQNLQIMCGSEELSIQAIENKNNGAFVIRVNVPLDAKKSEIEKYLKQEYKLQVKALDNEYRAKLEEKDKRIIEIYRQHSVNIVEIVKTLATQQSINIQAITISGNNSVSETFNNNFNQSNIANFTNQNQDNARQQANQNIYQSQQNQNLDGIKKEIQQLLNQLAQTNPTTDTVTEAVHQKIKSDPTFKARLQSALKAGGLEALKAIFNHPAFSIPAETIKGYLEAE
ncbi:MAG: pentapeptide repeat-containing protein [Nostoc sp. DedQUE01]